MSDFSAQEYSLREGRSLADRLRFMARFSQIVLVLMVFSFFSLIPIYLELRSIPVLIDMGITIGSILSLFFAYRAARQNDLVISGHAVLFVAVLIALGVSIEQGAPFFNGFPVLAGVFLTLMTVWPRRRLAWVLVLLVYVGLFWGGSVINLPIRYNLAETDSVGIRNGMIAFGTLSMAFIALIRFLQRGSIRARLLISYVLLATIPAVVIGVLVNLIYIQRVQNQVFAQLNSVATLKEQEILAWVNQLDGTLAITLDGDDADDLNRYFLNPGAADLLFVTHVQRQLAVVVQQTDLFSEIFVLDSEGHVIVSTNELEIGETHTNQTYFREGLVASYLQPPTAGSVSMLVSRPLRDSTGSVIGVIAGRVSLDELENIMLERVGLGETGETYLVGENMAPITRVRGTANNVRFVRTDGATTAVREQVDGQSLYPNYDELPVVGVYRWLPEMQMGLLAEQNQSEAFSALRTAAITAGVLNVVTFVVALGLALFVSRTIATPVIQLANAAQLVTKGDLDQAVMIERDDELGSLALAFNRMTEQLRQLIRGLEQRVAEQTRDLTLAAEVGQRVATQRNLDELLSAAAELIRERFNLYHTQIYLTDPTGQILLLRAGTGHAGEELLRRGHRLTVGPGSINGSVAAERRPIIVTNTLESAIFRSNPLLPQTRSEIAVPLLIGPRVVGVLDLQSAQPEALSAANLTGFQTLAGQLAIAIENAALFTEVEQARVTLEEQSRRLIHSGWDSYLDAISKPERLVYTYEADEKIVTLPAAADQPVVIPIQLGNEAIGFVEITGVPHNAWTPDKRALVDEIASRVAQQVENLRLLEEAEQYRGRAEQAVRRLTREGWDTYQRTTSETSHFTYTQNQVTPSTLENESTPNPALYVHPLLIRGETIGSLSMSESVIPGDETQELFTAVAEALTAHIENIRLSEATQTALSETETQAHRLTQLNDMSAQLNRATERNELLSIVLNQTPTLVGAQAAGIALVTADGAHINAFTLREGVVVMVTSPQGTDIPLAGTSTASIIAERTVRIIPDIQQNDALDVQDMARFGFLSLIQVPLILGDRVLGVLNIMSRQRKAAFSERDAVLLQQAASVVATTIENQRLFEETSKRAEREALINTINQRIQGTTSVETALETAAREIGQLLKARQAIVEIGVGVQNGKQA
ncbi:MAG: GAF domain-containing protein [Candidatus Promineifilaceae bacterium]